MSNSECQAIQGQWVEIYQIIMKPEERAPQVPDDTRSVPLEMRLRGFLITDKACLGDQVWIRTRIGREVAGVLSTILPSYDHNFGSPQAELLTIGQEVSKLLERGRE